MVNKFNKSPVLIKAGLAILISFIILWGLFTYYSYRESRDHDRLPVILNTSIKMEIVDNEFYNSSQYKDGDICSQAEQKAILRLVSEPEDNQYLTCRRFTADRSFFYWIDRNPRLQIVTLEEPAGDLKIIIEDTDDYGNLKGYPGINSFRMRGNSRDVIFIYEGWNNPRKIVRLLIN